MERQKARLTKFVIGDDKEPDAIEWSAPMTFPEDLIHEDVEGTLTAGGCP